MISLGLKRIAQRTSNGLLAWRRKQQRRQHCAVGAFLFDCECFLAAEDLLDLADFLFDEAVCLFGRAFVLQVRAVGNLADLFLDSALYFVELAFAFILGSGGSCDIRSHRDSPFAFAHPDSRRTMGKAVTEIKNGMIRQYSEILFQTALRRCSKVSRLFVAGCAVLGSRLF